MISRFVKDYFSRHKRRLNLVLHIIGVPQVFFGVYQLVIGERRWGICNVFLGYVLQWIGHRFVEKNEMGEVILIKKIAAKFWRRKGGD